MPPFNYQIVLLADASGSMTDNYKEIRLNAGTILAFAKEQMRVGGECELGLTSYLEETGKPIQWIPLGKEGAKARSMISRASG